MIGIAGFRVKAADMATDNACEPAKKFIGPALAEVETCAPGAAA